MIKTKETARPLEVAQGEKKRKWDMIGLYQCCLLPVSSRSFSQAYINVRSSKQEIRGSYDVSYHSKVTGGYQVRAMLAVRKIIDERGGQFERAAM
jgi:hypothetical protein